MTEQLTPRDDVMGTDTPPDGWTSVAVPPELREQLEDRIEGTEFESPDAYVTFVLETLLTLLEEPPDDDPTEVTDSETAVPPGLEHRLETLGYL